MLAIIAALIPVFLGIALGYLLRRHAFQDDGQWRLVDQLNYFVFFPLLLATSLGTADLSALAVWPVVGALLASLATVGGGLLLLRPALNVSGPEFSSVIQGTLRWNTNVALAAVASFYGAPGLAVMAVAIATLVPTLNVICVIVLARYGNGPDFSFAKLPGLLIRNPLILACVAGIVLNDVDLIWQSPLGATFEMLGQAALPVGLVSVGAALDLTHFRGKAGPIAITTVLKLLVMPVVMAGWCVVFGVTGLAYTVVIICGAVPGATAAYVLARQLGGDAPLMASMITASTVAAMITMPVMLYLLT